MFKFWQTMFRCSFCVFLTLLLLYYVHIWRNVGTGKVLSIGMYLNSEHVIKGPKWPINVTQKTFQNSLLIVGSRQCATQTEFLAQFPTCVLVIFALLCGNRCNALGHRWINFSWRGFWKWRRACFLFWYGAGPLLEKDLISTTYSKASLLSYPYKC